MQKVSVLLLTSNVGSMFEEGDEMIEAWLNTITSVVEKYKPRIVCIHCQEVGGKNFEISLPSLEKFIEKFLTLKVFEDFDRGRIHLDSDSHDSALFTALGKLCMFHKSLPIIHNWDFADKCYKVVDDVQVFFKDFQKSTCLLRIKYPKELFPDKRFSRKGYLHSRYLIGPKQLDLVNIHLFHDASNFIAKDEPSYYSSKRLEALKYVIDKLEKDNPDINSSPVFMFGDFNFRLNTRDVIEYLCGGTKEQHGENDKGEKRIEYMRNCDQQKLLHLEIKKFDYYDMGRFTIQAAREFRKFDQEYSKFIGDLHELPIRFPPSYPYSEDLSRGNQFMGTRCPAWCDRIFGSPCGMKLIKESPVEPVYNSLSPDGCVGDHKPVFLAFTMRIEDEGPHNGSASGATLDELNQAFQQVHKTIDSELQSTRK